MIDPIVEEVHRVREDMLARFNGDLRALVADIQRREQDLGRQVEARPPRRPEGWRTTVESVPEKRAG